MSKVPFHSQVAKGGQRRGHLPFFSDSYSDSQETTSAAKETIPPWGKGDTAFVLHFIKAFVSLRGSKVSYKRLPSSGDLKAVYNKIANTEKYKV